MSLATILAWLNKLSLAVKVLLITNILTATLMGYAAIRVRWFRTRFHTYQNKYEQVYREYKTIKAELDALKKIKPDGRKGGWFRDVEEGNNNSGNET